MAAINRGIALLARALGILSAIIVGIILLLVTASVVMRYLVSEPFRFTEELVGLLVLASVFLALPRIRLEDRDIRITAVTAILPERMTGVVFYVAQLVVVTFLALFGWDVWKQLQFAFRQNLATEVSRLPIWPWVGIMLMSIIIVGIIALTTRKPNHGARR